MKLIVDIAFQLPESMSREEALLRLSIRLRQMAIKQIETADDISGKIELVGGECL